jgi:hypothetical protein
LETLAGGPLVQALLVREPPVQVPLAVGLPVPEPSTEAGIEQVDHLDWFVPEEQPAMPPSVGLKQEEALIPQVLPEEKSFLVRAKLFSLRAFSWPLE